VKRILALLAGIAGLAALVRRRLQGQPGAPSPADELRTKLAEADARAGSGEEEPPTAERAVPDDDVAARRAEVHDRARQALDDLQ
jgi:hypothetical protein